MHKLTTYTDWANIKCICWLEKPVDTFIHLSSSIQLQVNCEAH